MGHGFAMWNYQIFQLSHVLYRNCQGILHDITLLVYDICVYPLLSYILMGYFPGPHQTWPWSKAWICYSYVFCWWSIYLRLSLGHHRRFIGNYRELISIERGFYKGTIWNYKGYIYIGNMIGTILGIYLLSPVIKHAWLGNLWTHGTFCGGFDDWPVNTGHVQRETCYK